MIKLKSELEAPARTPRPSRRRYLPRFLLLLVLVAVVALVVERWRGQWALKGWKRQMAANGEIFEAERLWPTPSAGSLEFSNRLSQVMGRLPPGLANYAAMLSGIVEERVGQYRRGSQERYPPMGQKENSANTWQALDLQITQAQPALATLRQLMKEPPPDMGYDIRQRLGDVSIPNFVSDRRGAQALHAAAIHELHKGNLPGALENLTALSGFTKLYADDPNLVNFMIRVAITGLSVDACWDALQANGWTEPQLASLQRTCQTDRLPLARMSRLMEAERATRLYELAWFRSHSYEGWTDRYKEVLQSFGVKNSAVVGGVVYQWRQYVFHPLWSFTWADQEELLYLQIIQGQIAELREAAKHGSWQTLDQQLTAHYKSYQPPTAAWRFYVALPVLDDISGIIGGSHASPATYPCPAFSKAWFVTMKNLTLHQMVIAAVALKRYQLRHGQVPQSLTALAPEFLAEVPHDFMDGQLLRYRLNSDGSFILYSVGEDGRDNGGDPLPAVSSQNQQNQSPWAGRDWVWPRAVAGTKTGDS
jgi:hypothetical protein